MSGSDGRTRRFSGSSAGFLPEPGESLIRNPDSLDNVPSYAESAGVAPPTILESTPLASGQTPRHERESSQVLASSLVQSSSPEEGANAGASASSPSAPILRQGNPPHFFSEQPHQVFYHDAVVYIEGEDVSPFLTGTISINYGFGSDYNKCDFTLDNAAHRFTITPENLRGIFRTSSPLTQGGSFDYDESVKAQMYARKSDIRYNPVDPASGGRRFPLHLWSTIFHKHDAVRIWIHNPASENDEWLPVFAGFVISKPVTEDYITGLNTLSVSCADIRSLMASMRVNTTTMMAVNPGAQTTDAADPTGGLPFSGQGVWRNFAGQSNRQFDTSFFAQLVVGSNMENPWNALNLPEMIAALTFLPGVNTGLFNAAGARAAQNASGNRDRARDEARRIAGELQPLLDRVNATGIGSLSSTEATRYNQLRAALENLGVRGEQIQATARGDFPPDTNVEETEQAATASTPAAVPGQRTPPTTRGRQVGEVTGSGRVGRMRPGVFPYYSTINNDPPRPYADESRFPSGRDVEAVRTSLSRWYSLCIFGTPVRHNFVPSSRSTEPEDAAPDYSAVHRRYWTEAEVREAGRSTRREGAWHPEAQGVHFLSPGRNTPNDLIWESSIITARSVGTNLNWTNRLQLLSDGCDVVDYRFWVSGSGDLVFEFAQYDFSPEDYGGWSSVLTLDHHLLNESFDEEGGEVVTGVLANGSFVALGGVDEGNITELNPARSVGIWSPNLASRLGLNLKVLTFAQITDNDRLEQLATLEFQKLLAAADKFQISVAFRPWLVLNRPIFNAYRERIALIDGLSWTLPVTAGQVAGQQPPSMSVTLNYTRTYDEVGLPRYITGGPSNPMYFGHTADPSASLTRLLAARVADFRSALTSLAANPVTQDTLTEVRNRYRAVVPSSQSTYNVIDAIFQGADPLPPGETRPLTSAFRALDESLASSPPGSGGATEEQTQAALREIEAQTETLQQTLRDQQAASASSATQSSDDVAHTAAGVRPSLNITGVRSTRGPTSDYEPTEAPPVTEDPTCSPGDPRFYSAPTAPTNRTIPKWNTFRNDARSRASRGSSASSRLLAYSNGQISDSDLASNVGIAQYAGEFPRIVTSGFGFRQLRDSNWHPGVDIPLDFGAEVYAVADGIVYFTRENTPSAIFPNGQGKVIGLMHAGGYVTHYNHQDHFADGIQVGSLVKRNQVISYCGRSGSEQGETEVHLHFETGAIAGSELYQKYVGRGKMWRVVTPAEENALQREIAAAPTEAARQLLMSSSRAQQIIGSRHLVFGYTYNPTSFYNSLTPDLIDRFDLGFLRQRDGSIALVSKNVLHYSPVPKADPFSEAGLNGPLGDRFRDVISLQDYYNTGLGGFKGIPAIMMYAVPNRYTLAPVPDLPGPTATDVQARRIIQQRATVMASNERIARRAAAYTTTRNAQLALFANEIPPNLCPPERYEGNTQRQAGEPITTQRRLTNETAEAARRGTR